MSKKRLFFGDSLVADIPEGIKIINTGIGGMTSTGLLTLLDQTVYDHDPTDVYLHIGTNDFGMDPSTKPKKVAKNVKKIFKKIKRKLPKANLNLISTLPSSDNPESVFDLGQGIRRNDLHIKLNEEYQKIIKDLNINYIDLYQFLVDENGDVIDKYYKDDLHLNVDGYRLLINKFDEVC